VDIIITHKNPNTFGIPDSTERNVQLAVGKNRLR
jgi:hypothetical protein